MLKSAASKVIWAGRATVSLVGLAVILALVFGVASTALGANGGNFILGKASNTATKVTGLIGKVATGSALVVKNPSGGSALGLQVNAGQAPLTVNPEAGKATNLDADKLDGVDSTELVRGSGELTFNRTALVAPNTSVELLDVPNVGRLDATCGGVQGTSVTLTYTADTDGPRDGKQQFVADQRSEDGTEATDGGTISPPNPASKAFSFPNNDQTDKGHRLFLQVAPLPNFFPADEPVVQGLTTFDVSAITRIGGHQKCSFQGLAIVQGLDIVR